MLKLCTGGRSSKSARAAGSSTRYGANPARRVSICLEALIIALLLPAYGSGYGGRTRIYDLKSLNRSSLARFEQTSRHLRRTQQTRLRMDHEAGWHACKQRLMPALVLETFPESAYCE